MTVVYYGVMVLVGYLFVSKIEVKKPGVKGVMILCVIGALEFLIMMILRASTH
jgi:phosphatidylserine synthase